MERARGRGRGGSRGGAGALPKAAQREGRSDDSVTRRAAAAMHSVLGSCVEQHTPFGAAEPRMPIPCTTATSAPARNVPPFESNLLAPLV